MNRTAEGLRDPVSSLFDHNSRRRRWLKSAATLAAASCLQHAPVLAHNDAGQVSPPALAPATPVIWHSGQQGSLRDSLKGHVTAVQTMFTGCSASCPIQGALFAQVQSLLPAQNKDLQLLSLSIDPLADDPRSLSRWLARFSAQPAWRAGAPNYKALEDLLSFLRARTNKSDRHTAQVYLFNRNGELVLRTADFPPPQQIASLLNDLARRG